MSRAGPDPDMRDSRDMRDSWGQDRDPRDPQRDRRSPRGGDRGGTLRRVDIPPVPMDRRGSSGRTSQASSPGGRASSSRGSGRGSDWMQDEVQPSRGARSSVGSAGGARRESGRTDGSGGWEDVDEQSISRVVLREGRGVPPRLPSGGSRQLSGSRRSSLDGAAAGSEVDNGRRRSGEWGPRPSAAEQSAAVERSAAGEQRAAQNAVAGLGDHARGLGGGGGLREDSGWEPVVMEKTAPAKADDLEGTGDGGSPPPSSSAAWPPSSGPRGGSPSSGEGEIDLVGLDDESASSRGALKSSSPDEVSVEAPSSGPDSGRGRAEERSCSSPLETPVFLPPATPPPPATMLPAAAAGKPAAEVTNLSGDAAPYAAPGLQVQHTVQHPQDAKQEDGAQMDKWPSTSSFEDSKSSAEEGVNDTMITADSTGSASHSPEKTLDKVVGSVVEEVLMTNRSGDHDRSEEDKATAGASLASKDRRVLGKEEDEHPTEAPAAELEDGVAPAGTIAAPTPSVDELVKPDEDHVAEPRPPEPARKRAPPPLRDVGEKSQGGPEQPTPTSSATPHPVPPTPPVSQITPTTALGALDEQDPRLGASPLLAELNPFRQPGLSQAETSSSGTPLFGTSADHHASSPRSARSDTSEPNRNVALNDNIKAVVGALRGVDLGALFADDRLTRTETRRQLEQFGNMRLYE